MINWRRIEDHPDTEVEYYDRPQNDFSPFTYACEREVILPGRWLFYWSDGSIEAASTDEPLTPAEWPGRMVERPNHWAEFNEPETGE